MFCPAKYRISNDRRQKEDERKDVKRFEVKDRKKIRRKK